MTLLEARGLHRFYRRGGRPDSEVAALKDVNLAVGAGEMVAVVGPSGAGKSTLLAMLAGLDEPDGGSVQIAGEALSHRPRVVQSRIRAQRIGVLTQASGLVDHLSLAANVSLAGSFREVPVSADDVGAVLDRLELKQLAGAYPSTLSGGETARANLAVALIGTPDVLLADEPTAEISSEEERNVLRLLRHTRSEVGATVLVTHSEAIAAAADRVLTLVDGTLR